MNPTDPVPGDRWTRDGYAEIEVVSVTHGDVYFSYKGKPNRLPLDKFRNLAENSITLGAVMRRGKEVFSKELEGFEV